MTNTTDVIPTVDENLRRERDEARDIAAQMYREIADMASNPIPSINWRDVEFILRAYERFASEATTGPLRERYENGDRSRELADLICARDRRTSDRMHPNDKWMLL